MSLATFDLANYQTARFLRLLPQLNEVFDRNVFCFPQFYTSLHPSAKQAAFVVLLCLQRWLCGSARDAALSTSPYRRQTLWTVLSFLSFDSLRVDLSDCLSRYVVLGKEATLSASPQSTEAVSNVTPVLSRSKEEESPKPLRLEPSVVDVEREAPAELTSPPLTAAPSMLSNDLLHRAVFFVRPPPLAPNSAASAASRYAGVTHLFVRMIHPSLLNEESLNPYFGRYGQVDCRPLHRTPLPAFTPLLGPVTTRSILQLFPSTPSADFLYLQDFIIAVDSPQNALHAVQRAHYRELQCIALHDSTGRLNSCSIADVNQWMASHTAVLRLHGEAAAAVGDEAGDGSSAAASSPVSGQKRQRKSRSSAKQFGGSRQIRQLPRQQEGGRKKCSSASSSSSSSSSPSSSSASSSSSNHDSSSQTSSGSSSNSSSSRSSEDSENESATHRFIPDVLIDGFPYWMTEDQLKVLLQEHGVVAQLQMSIDDLSGAFSGCVLVRMSSVEEAIRVSRAFHDILHRGHRLISGVVNEKLDVVALEDDSEVRVINSNDLKVSNIAVNETLWV